ncbi:hypothetical protein T484DRAFT_1826845, partial [Baffinella frigidus]
DLESAKDAAEKAEGATHEMEAASGKKDAAIKNLQALVGGMMSQVASLVADKVSLQKEAGEEAARDDSAMQDLEAAKDATKDAEAASGKKDGTIKNQQALVGAMMSQVASLVADKVSLQKEAVEEVAKANSALQ